MDEGTLNDLLECSVCLDRLDTSSKVLPCQHTFCKKCLDEIVHKHKELRCPECRILVQAKVEDLPPNVLLMRILEGMKNAGNQIPNRLTRGNHGSPTLIHSNVFHQHTTVDHHRSISNKQQTLPLISHQPYAKAVYDYASKESGDLSFKRGDIIILKKKIDNHWYQGESGGKLGVFPLSYVQIITPVPSHLPQCKALFDFRMTNDEEEGCLAFNKGDIINVIRRVDENWAEGKLDGRIGIFPLAFVEMNNLAKSLMKLSSNVQPGPSRVAPPTPTLDDSTPLIPTDHTKIVQHQIFHQNSSTIADSGESTPSTTSSGSSSTPNISSSNTSSGASTAPSSPASPPHVKAQLLPPKSTVLKQDQLPNTKQCSTPQRLPLLQNSHQPLEEQSFNHHDKEKRHSFTGLPKPHNTAPTTNRHSAEILTSDGQITSSNLSQTSERSVRSAPAVPIHDIQLPATYVALYPYKPQKVDELELRKGSIYIVTERCQDGWYKGTSNRTQKCGVFPGNYVTLARGIPKQSGNTGKDGLNDPKLPVSFNRSGKTVMSSGRSASNPPELPPRSTSPANTISSSWHGHQTNVALPLGRSSSTIMSGVITPQHTLGINIKTDKTKERKEKSSVSLMKRLASMKRSKSPPSSTYSMDNPVFEDSSIQPATSPGHPVHVRSGSCPSQLLQIQHGDHHRMFGSNSHRHKHKERPTILTHSLRTGENPGGSSGSSPDIHHHRKSSSLDAGNKAAKTGVQTVRERFRCIAPYPPNTEYELELQVNDIIYVHKKRDDGWYKGTQQRTGKTGLFPASFVEIY